MRNRALVLTSLAFVAFSFVAAAAQAEPASSSSSKLSPVLRARAARAGGWSRVIVRTGDPSSLTGAGALIQQAGGTLGRRLGGINGHVATIPNAQLARLVASPLVRHISLDPPVVATMERTGATVGAAAVRQELGYDGTGVGVAVIDSGVTPWHDDLSGGPSQRVLQFVDFVGGQSASYDDFGHGTHVAGVVAGNGFDSNGARTGMAPGSHLMVLKVLDGTGAGHVSDVIAALDYVVANKAAFNIRVVNLSIAAAVNESYNTDPLALATRRAVDAGLVVVSAAGNVGRAADGRALYRSVMAPGNAPWVLTVGASSHMGTIDRADDTVAAFSAHGPTAVDYTAKPDLVAPGVGIESLSDPASAFYTTKSAYLLNGTVSTSYSPYLSLSGTSTSAPVVSGTVALMLQANPSLTPNQVKAILQYTAQVYPGYDTLTQGAGFLNAKGAVELAHFYTAPAVFPMPSTVGWGQRLIWGTRLVTGGTLTPTANAFGPGVTWGAEPTPAGLDSPNVVWGSMCGGADCQVEWTVTGAGGSVLGADSADTVVWGSNGADTVVWGSDGDDTVVWGSGDDGDTVVWGSTCGDSSCDVVWSSN
jgi:serine protease AprX